MGAHCIKEITMAEAQAKIITYLIYATDEDIETIVNNFFMDRELTHYKIL